MKTAAPTIDTEY